MRKFIAADNDFDHWTGLNNIAARLPNIPRACIVGAGFIDGELLATARAPRRVDNPARCRRWVAAEGYLYCGLRAHPDQVHHAG